MYEPFFWSKGINDYLGGKHYSCYSSNGADEIPDRPEATVLTLEDIKRDGGWQDGILVPGGRAEVSCGIAIAHAHHPLQQVVAEARRAEHRAKHDYGRSAFAVSLLKRGGEIIHWGANWQDGALPLFRKFLEMTLQEKVSKRFPYVLAGLLAPYRLQDGAEKFAPEFHPREVIAGELEQVLARQVEDKEQRPLLREMSLAYLDALDRKKRWGDFEKLFLSAAFIGRGRSDDGKEGGQA